MILNTPLSKKDLEVVIEALLFASTVHIVSDVHEKHCSEQFELAKRLKTLCPDIKLNNVQFLIDENYEEPWTESILNEFKDNMKVVDFKNV